MSRRTPPVVFIHGFKGAHLDHAQSGRRHWLRGLQALGRRVPGVEMPLHWQAGVQGHDQLVPAEPLGKVLHVPFYQPFMRWCAQRSSAFYPFVYDWRRDNSEAVTRFSDFLRTISSRHDDEPVQVIAHSNGGLITYAVMATQPELLHSVVFAATPFGGGVGMLEDLHLGVKTGFNSHLASPQVMSSFVTSFAFFPLPHESSQALAKGGQLLPLDWYDVVTWQEYQLGPFRPGEAVGHEQTAHLRNALRVTKAFRERIAVPLSAYPPIAVIASDYSPTLAAIKQDPDAPLGWNFDHCAHEPGDGRVRFSSCHPPRGVPFKLYKTRQQHSQVLSDFSALERAMDDLCAN